MPNPNNTAPRCPSKDALDRWFRSDDWRLRSAALRLYPGHDMPLELPDVVYKRCLGDVVVTARIPGDAQVRKGSQGGYRADKAVILDVIGTTEGEAVGVSLHDQEILYYPGEVVDVPDFDQARTSNATGFHFCLTKEGAMQHWIVPVPMKHFDPK